MKNRSFGRKGSLKKSEKKPIQTPPVETRRKQEMPVRPSILRKDLGRSNLWDIIKDYFHR